MTVIKIKNFINGEFVECKTELTSVNPATAEVIATLPDSSEAEVNAAVSAAQLAFKT